MCEYKGPHDYFDENYVQEWERIANSRRPFRIQFFDAFAAELQPLAEAKILELGSGPGFLAEYILTRCRVAAYHLFDFSPPMLKLSRARLAGFADRVFAHEGSFLDEGWWKSLPGPFDAVISMQAVHEALRVEHIPQLYAESRLLIKAGGVILIADKLDNELKDEANRFTADKHLAALSQAGFKEIRQVKAAGDLVMFAARN